MNQKMDLTVAIPTYNGGQRLPFLLNKLLVQTGLEELMWEILVVNNNSSDNTIEVVRTYQENWTDSFSLSLCTETRQGAAYARLMAVREAKGDLVAFLDDDNLPASDWLIAAYNFGIEHPQAGAWSSQIHGQFEVKPPENFKIIERFLAIEERGQQPHLFKPEHLILPPGAGFVVRKKVWLNNVPSTPVLTGKLPGLFIQGEDYEPLLHMYYAGWEIWYNPKMHTYHQIPQWRLEEKYLLSLARAAGLCIFHLRIINTKVNQKPTILSKTVLGNFLRLIKLLWRYRHNKTDFICRFEAEFYLGAIISPLYYLRYYLLKNFKI